MIFTAKAVADYREKTAAMKPIGNKKMCSACHQPRNQAGGVSVARPGSRHRDWKCSFCVEGK